MGTNVNESPMLNAATWDAIVIGAGPAGGVSALLLARQGWRVLLVERSAWPRNKVCGGCINANAVELLNRIGLGQVIRRAPTLNRCVVRGRRREISVRLPAGAAVTRREFDAEIVKAFIDAGGTFIDRTSAVLLPTSTETRHVEVRTGSDIRKIEARVILACDGISGGSLEHEPWAAWKIARDAWFGVAATLTPDAVRIDSGRIAMHVGDGGYVGLLREASGTIHLAAAFDPNRCKQQNGPAAFSQHILHTCGHADVDLQHARFTGTGLLTRRRIALGGHRVLTVGDACGYVEPFTGEGIAWAIRSAIEATELVLQHGQTWPIDTPAMWAQRHRRTVGRQQKACRMLRFALHRPWLANSALRVGTSLPAIATIVTRLTQHTLPDSAEAFV